MNLDGIEVEALKDGALLVVRHDLGRRIVQRIAPEDPIHSFFFPLAGQDSSVSTDGISSTDLAQWLVGVGPMPLDDYPDVNPTEFRFPWCESVQDLTWCGVDSPFVTFISGREKAGKTSLLSGIRATASQLNRTEVVSLQYSEEFARMDLALTRMGQELSTEYRLNTTATKNPFRKKSKIFLIDDFPSTDVPSHNEEVLLGALYDFLTNVQGIQEFVKVFVASERPLSNLLLGATGGNYTMLSEITDTASMLEVAQRVSPASEITEEHLGNASGDILGWNLWSHREVLQGHEVETVVKSPQVDLAQIKQFVADGSPDEEDLVASEEPEEAAESEPAPAEVDDSPRPPVRHRRPAGGLPDL